MTPKRIIAASHGRPSARSARRLAVGVLCGLVAGIVFSPSASASDGVPNPAPGIGGTTNGKIAYTSDRLGGRKQIWVMDADGRNQTPLTSSFAAADGASWSPDGTKIAFIGIDASKASWVYVMNADGSGLRRVVASGREHFDAPAWSPDGQQIAYSHPGKGIFVVNSTAGIHIDDRGPRPLTLPWPNFMEAPYWSPDGKRMLFRTFDPERNNAIYAINADGSGNPTEVIDRVGDSAPGGWFPGSTKIAYNGYGGVHDINVINVDGSGHTSVFTPATPEGDVAVSPDGQKFVFKSIAIAAEYDPAMRFDIYTMNVNGTGRARLNANAPGGEVSHPSWQPLNRKIDASVSEGNPPTILCGPGDRAWTAGEARIVCNPKTRLPVERAPALG